MQKLATMLVAASLFAVLSVGGAWAAPAKLNFPTRAINMVVPHPPGGATDLMARLISEYAQEYLGQPLVVINRAGVGGLVGTTEFINAKATGYEILMAANSAFSTQPFLRDVPFTIENFRIIAGLSWEPLVLCVNAAAPYNSFAEMVEYYKKNGGAPKFGHTGAGGVTHINQKQLFAKAGIKAVDVAFSGGADLMTNLLGGHIDAATASLIEGHNYIREKQFKVLGIFSDVRDASDLYKNVPTFKELGYDVQLVINKFLCVPAATPAPVVQFLEDAFAKIFADKRWVDFCKKTYITPYTGRGQEIKAKLLVEIEATHRALIEMGMAKK